MNNAFILDNIQFESTEDKVQIDARLRSEESKIIKIIEALREIQSSKGWKILKAEIFDGLVNTLEKELFTEANEVKADPKKLNRLAGELKWANRYSDLSKLEDNYKGRLQSIRINLYGKKE